MGVSIFALLLLMMMMMPTTTTALVEKQQQQKHASCPWLKKSVIYKTVELLLPLLSLLPLPAYIASSVVLLLLLLMMPASSVDALHSFHACCTFNKTSEFNNSPNKIPKKAAVTHTYRSDELDLDQYSER